MIHCEAVEITSDSAPAPTIVAPFRRYLLFRMLPLASLAVYGLVWTVFYARGRTLYETLAVLAAMAALMTFNYKRFAERTSRSCHHSHWSIV